MTQDLELVRVARIGKPHGIKGDVTVQVFTDSPEERFQPGQELTVNAPDNADSVFPTLTVARARWNKNILLLGFEEFSDRNSAENHRNCHLYALPMEFEADDDAWYSAELEGFAVYQVADPDQQLGTVKELIPGEAQDLLEISGTKGETFLVPFVEEIVPEIDTEKQRVLIDPPPGLLELN